jgi:DNA-binding response OmpR family regulator
MRRRILLVDDEVAVLLTLKAVLEISGFDVDTAASGREGVSKLQTREYQMLITDMRMEHDAAGVEVIKAARAASYHPAVALLTAFPVAEEDWQEMGADELLVKPMHTRILLQQIEDLIASHERKLAKLGLPTGMEKQTPPATSKKGTATKAVAKKVSIKKPAKKPAVKAAVKKVPAKKPALKKTAKKAAKTSRKPKSTPRRTKT